MNDRLMRDPGASLHHQVSAVLRSHILSGKYGLGTNLPSEAALTALFGVSRATVRRALLTLETEGLVARRQGKGTSVSWQRPATVVTSMSKHQRWIDRHAEGTNVKVLSFDRQRAPSSVVAALRIDAETEPLKIIRVRYRDDQPLWHMTNYISPDIAGNLTLRQLQTSPLMAALANVGHAVHRAEDDVGAVLADPPVAKALGIRIGAPLIEIARLMMDRHGTPIAFQWSLIPPERHKLRIVLDSETNSPIGPAAAPGILAPINGGKGSGFS